MELNSFALGTRYLSYLSFIDEEKEIVYFSGWKCMELAEWSAAYQNNNAVVTCSVFGHLPMSTILKDQPRVSHQRSHTSTYVRKLVAATYVRHLRQTSDFMFPLPRRPGDPVVAESWLSMDRRIGGTQCPACVFTPSHILIPCEHTVCYDHFLQHPEEFDVRCALCLKPVITTLEIDETNGTTNSSNQDLSALTQGLRLSPASTVNSIWGGPLPTPSPYQSLNASIADMRHPASHTSTPPAAGDEVQLGATNRGVINHAHTMSGPKHTISPPATSGQVIQDQNDQAQQLKHTRFPSFNPGRPAGANFPEHVITGQGQNASEPKQPWVNKTQQRPSDIGHNGSQIHAPQPCVFKASHAFRELATPTPETDNSEFVSAQQQFASTHAQTQQVPGPIQRPDPAYIDPRFRSLMSPVQMDRSPGASTMPASMRHMNSLNNHAGSHGLEAAHSMRSSIPQSFNNMLNGLTGSGHLTNGAHMNGLNNVQHSYDAHSNGFHMDRTSMNVSYMNQPHLNAPQMNGSHFQTPQVLSPQMNRLHISGQQMNSHQMAASMPIHRGIPAQADPFVDTHHPVYGNGPFGAGANNYQPLAAAPQPVFSTTVGSPVSNIGTAYTWGRFSQQTNNQVNVAQQLQTNIVQQPQTHAARMAEVIKSGALRQLESRSPSDGRGYLSPGGDSPGNALVLQQPVIRSQAVMGPEVRPDPDWVRPEDRALPNLDEVYEHMPFVDTAAESRPCTNGVIKIGNIPYATTKNEVIAALGRSTRIASQPKGTAYFAIHIIMERSTGKTMDVYVELDSVEEAKATVASFHQRCLNNRHPRIGDRHVDIELSSQEALMKELFPRAKCVNWDGHTPVVYSTTEAYNSGFQGFVTSEEMVMITKHAETPQRSPFAQRCVNRTYETMISIMHKYPWHAPEHITIRERISLFSCALIQLRVLINAVSRNSHPQLLHRGLLQEYLTACLGNPGFSVQQKTYIVNCTTNEGYGALLGMVPFTPVDQMTGSWWAFEALSKNPKSSNSLLAYIIALLSSATDPDGTFARNAIADPNSCLELLDLEMAADSTFGHFGVKYKSHRQRDMHSLKEAADAEWRAVYEALSRVLPTNRALTFGESHLAGGDQQDSVEGAEKDNTAFEGGQVLALPGLEQRREDALLG
ncbi:hypothetical protein QM012_003228 [Aureobasidium pullulans]|uniref:RRM domain-containing protein n=1 Tax=Aureobasidium pullulans TaxID=5580 RepID=A0ABR0TB17_AURPU